MEKGKDKILNPEDIYIYVFAPDRIDMRNPDDVLYDKKADGQKYSQNESVDVKEINQVQPDGSINKVGDGKIVRKELLARYYKQYKEGKSEIFTSKCESFEEKVENPKSTGEWYDPIDNPQINKYNFGGNISPRSANFGNTRVKTNGSRRFHAGIDLFAIPQVTKVYASLDCSFVSSNPVDKDEYTIRLVVDEKNAEGTTILGILEISPIFKQFGINSGKKWSPQDLGEFFKMNRSYFPSKETNMKLVSLLRNFTAKVDSDVEQQKDQKGSHSNLYRQTVNSNLPEEFTICLPIFKGGEAQEVVVETYADVDGGSMSITLVSAGANEFRDEQVDKQIDSVIENIKSIAPDIVIIYK